MRWTIKSRSTTVALAITVLAACSPSDRRVRSGEETARPEVSSGRNQPEDNTVEKAYFAAGCFWGVEAAFRETPGVVETSVGYGGGTLDRPTYKDVCSGATGHAEVVEVAFDPAGVSYEDLLEVFWKCHDPTQLNRQGPDIGDQYRSAIFFTNSEQQVAAEASKRELQDSGKYARPVVTEITASSTFHRAEEYHQQYLEKQGRAGCSTGH